MDITKFIENFQAWLFEREADCFYRENQLSPNDLFSEYLDRWLEDEIFAHSVSLSDNELPYFEIVNLSEKDKTKKAVIEENVDNRCPIKFPESNSGKRLDPCFAKLSEQDRSLYLIEEYDLRWIGDRCVTAQIFHAYRNRDWNFFTKLAQAVKSGLARTRLRIENLGDVHTDGKAIKTAVFRIHHYKIALEVGSFLDLTKDVPKEVSDEILKLMRGWAGSDHRVEILKSSEEFHRRMQLWAKEYQNLMPEGKSLESSLDAVINWVKNPDQHTKRRRKKKRSSNQLDAAIVVSGKQKHRQ